MTDWSEVRKHARAVRSWTEQYATEHNFSPRLTCLCAVASAKLHERFIQHNIKASIGMAHDDMVNFSHVFIIVEDSLVDITATQFGNHPKVTIKKLIDARKLAFTHWYWDINYQFDSSKSLYDYQQSTKWPVEQICLAV